MNGAQLAITTVTITASYQSTDGTSASGTVTFQLSQPIANNNVIYHTAPKVATLNGSGSISLSLVANDDSGTTPTGTSYIVTEAITGAPEREYQIIVTHTNTTVDLSTLMPGTAPPVS